jgi:hypothetical protein
MVLTLARSSFTSGRYGDMFSLHHGSTWLEMWNLSMKHLVYLINLHQTEENGALGSAYIAARRRS